MSDDPNQRTSSDSREPLSLATLGKAALGMAIIAAEKVHEAFTGGAEERSQRSSIKTSTPPQGARKRRMKRSRKKQQQPATAPAR